MSINSQGTDPRDFTPGMELAPVTRILSKEEVLFYTNRGAEFGGRPTDKKNIHNDEETAQSYGFRGVVAAGVQTMPYIWSLFHDKLGESWDKGGLLSVTFTNMVCGDDTLEIRAIVRESKDGESDDRIYFDTWIENQLGEKVIVGKASIPAAAGSAN
jgi:acyl dehydratase